MWLLLGATVVSGALALAQQYSPPAGVRPSHVDSAVSILPGGRVIAPMGEQHVTGAEPLALALSSSGKVLITANRGNGRSSLTVMEHGKTWGVRQLPVATAPLAAALVSRGSDEGWRSVSTGLALSGEHSVFVSEGNTGRVSLIDLETGERRRAWDVAPGGFTGDLAWDAARNILYVADLADSRLTALDGRSRRTLASVVLPGVPVALALEPASRKLYVTLARNLMTGGTTGAGVCVVDVTHPPALRVETVIRGKDWMDGGLSSILATPDHVFVSDADHDSITLITSRTNQVETRIALRIPGLVGLRGIRPMGMAFDESRGWLLVAEPGINALGIIDVRTSEVLGHIPVGWFPTQVAVSHGMVYVANRKGPGAGPNTRGSPGPWGSVSMFALPDPAGLEAATRFVLAAAGFSARPGTPPPLPKAIRHVVLIVKDGRSFDEIFGGVTRASSGTVMGAPPLARFGRDGYVDGQKQRLSLHHLNVTPNHQAIAARWTFSDNFYADSDTGAEGVHWLAAWKHLARHGVSVFQFRDGAGTATPDTERARRLIGEIERRFAAPGADLPGLIEIHLPNDRMAPADPDSGFPYAESYLADNDLALGRILEYFSSTKWWGQMAVFVTEASAEDGVDHIDAHRTLLLCAGPWARKNWVSHTNASFPALLKTIFRLFDVPSLNLFDASAADLSDCFTDASDPARYRAVAVDPRLYRAAP